MMYIGSVGVFSCRKIPKSIVMLHRRMGTDAFREVQPREIEGEPQKVGWLMMAVWPVVSFSPESVRSWVRVYCWRGLENEL